MKPPMKTRQFDHSMDILYLLDSTVDHLQIKWQLYNSIGYLPNTNYVFEDIKDMIDQCKTRIRNADEAKTNKELLLDANPFFIKNLQNLRTFLYYDIGGLSDMVNALDYGFLNRLSGILAAEPTLGTETTSRPFGGIQLVYNATESLMKDYVENVKGITYGGAVIFGFENRAVSYPPLVYYPSYAEHDLEYLLILAHEAYHLLRRKVSTDVGVKLGKIQRVLQEELVGLASLYLPETIKDRNAHHELTAGYLADDILADIYATIVAGESYPKISCDYYLPVMLDTSAEPNYSAFVIGSLKIRASVTALEAMNWDDKDGHIQKIIDEVKGKIEEWEELSVQIALDQLGRAGLLNLGLYRVEDKLDSICEAIKRENITARMLDIIEQPYYPKNKHRRDVLRDKLNEVMDIVSGDPTPEDLAKIWVDDAVRPRHLISLVAQGGKKINRNAILLSMGYHKNILDRFTPQPGDIDGRDGS